MEACQVTAQRLEVIAGRRPQVVIGGRVVDHLELAEEPAFEFGPAPIDLWGMAPGVG